MAFGGVLDDPLAQTGLGLFGLSWLGLVYLHVEAMNTPEFLRGALKRGLGENYRNDIPAERQAELSARVTDFLVGVFHLTPLEAEGAECPDARRDLERWVLAQGPRAGLERDAQGGLALWMAAAESACGAS